MKFVIPVLVTRRRVAGNRVHHVRPLFFDKPEREDQRLERALQRLADDLREHLTELLKRFDHTEAARWTFNPNLEPVKVTMLLELRKRTLRLRLQFFLFSALGRRVAFCPSYPDLWFDVNRGEKVEERATATFAEYFRKLEKLDEDFTAPEEEDEGLSSWVTPIDFSLYQVPEPPEQPDARAALGGAQSVRGASELRRVGRCLDHLFPEGLDRAALRRREVDELGRLLSRPERRAVLLAGPRLAGKTTVLHEVVYRRVAARRETERFSNDGRTWLLSPQRLISGMSYVGQWEGRLLAILRHCARHDHVLYFDDLLGLYQAGQSASSTLSAAEVLKPWLTRGEVRVVAEMTPEALRVLRERDRGLADLFAVVPVPATNDEDTVRVLISVQRQLEAAHKVQFSLDALPAVLDVQRRHARDQAFPGKAAQFLRRMAVKNAGARLDRRDVFWEFNHQTGLSMLLVDPRRRLERQDVVEGLREKVIGQEAAVQAAADVIGIAKARLNDPGRPLASLLFLGPTGVGKTEMAKAVASLLFTGEEKLIRFDMNEYVTPGSAARLAGTFWQPEGLLTSAVRRRPFAVILLDEIEKADPEVFDLLLQVLGEGRLTDALGRTADFTGAIIVMTSNLGVREAERVAGLRGGENRGAYEEAARAFFRPEFFNRIDRIVPFNRLTRPDVEKIARGLISSLLRREGLVRRKCVLRVEPEAMGRIVERGFDPVMGARALKRAIERHLAQPVARRLAEGLPETVCVLPVVPSGDGVTAHVIGLGEARRLPPGALPETGAALDGIARALRRIEAGLGALRREGEITVGSVSREQELYFVLREQAEALRGSLEEAREAWEKARQGARVPSLPAKARVRSWIDDYGPVSLLREISTADDIGAYLRELAQQARPLDSGREWLRALAQGAAVLDLIAREAARPGGQQALLYAWSADPEGARRIEALLELYEQETFLPAVGDEEGPGWWAPERVRLKLPEAPFARGALLLRGLAAEVLAGFEQGTHLTEEGPEVLMEHVLALAVPDGEAPEEVAFRLERDNAAWLQALARGEAKVEDCPLAPPAVHRVYSRDVWVDARTGACGDMPCRVTPLIRAGLPLPAELSREG